MILVKPIFNQTGFDCGDNDRFVVSNFEKKIFLAESKKSSSLIYIVL